MCTLDNYILFSFEQVEVNRSDTLNLTEYQQILQDMECWMTGTFQDLSQDLEIANSDQGKCMIFTYQVSYNFDTLEHSSLFLVAQKNRLLYHVQYT